ncbi:DUF7146 domain-containing protein [Sphingomonas sp. Leaf4]|uniref:DUF7146 domain-containing protein n=1 Tax=Sphingomonas sp. Leaf4 TaxID=2876553 RepID=UPI001E443655|nr:toprim domain-containing protein [Sphingomonas sp. Leaf4]
MPVIARPPEPNLRAIVDALGGTWTGYTAMCRCPAHADNTPSLSLRQGDRGILVTCFAGCDPLDVLRAIDDISLSGRPPPAVPAHAGGTANIERLWNEARDVRGTLAERYLAARHLLPANEDLRFHPRCPLGAKPMTRFLPALLVGVREGSSLVAFQRIFLNANGSGYTEKATLGTLGTGAWRGGGIAATIALGEGYESARAYTRLKGVPCWSSFGTRRFDLIDVPDTVTTLILAADRDAAGRAAVVKAIRRYCSAKRIVRVDYPPVGFKDWAEVLAAQEERGTAAG